VGPAAMDPSLWGPRVCPGPSRRLGLPPLGVGVGVPFGPLFFCAGRLANPPQRIVEDGGANGKLFTDIAANASGSRVHGLRPIGLHLWQSALPVFLLRLSPRAANRSGASPLHHRWPSAGASRNIRRLTPWLILLVRHRRRAPKAIVVTLFVFYIRSSRCSPASRGVDQRLVNMAAAINRCERKRRTHQRER